MLDDQRLGRASQLEQVGSELANPVGERAADQLGHELADDGSQLGQDRPRPARARAPTPRPAPEPQFRPGAREPRGSSRQAQRRSRADVKACPATEPSWPKLGNDLGCDTRDPAHPAGSASPEPAAFSPVKSCCSATLPSAERRNASTDPVSAERVWSRPAPCEFAADRTVNTIPATLPRTVKKSPQRAQARGHPLAQLSGLAGVRDEVSQMCCGSSEPGREAGQEVRADRREIPDDPQQRSGSGRHGADRLAGAVEDQPDVIDRAAFARERGGVAGGEVEASGDVCQAAPQLRQIGSAELLDFLAEPVEQPGSDVELEAVQLRPQRPDRVGGLPHRCGKVLDRLGVVRRASRP